MDEDRFGKFIERIILAIALVALALMTFLLGVSVLPEQEHDWNVTVYFKNGKVMTFKAVRRATANEDFLYVPMGRGEDQVVYPIQSIQAFMNAQEAD